MSKLILPEGWEEAQLWCGAHYDRKEGVCVMEAVAWLSGEEHSDAPKCVPKSLARFLRHWNDAYATDEYGRKLRTQWLKPLIIPLIEARFGDWNEDDFVKVDRQIEKSLNIWWLREILPIYAELHLGAENDMMASLRHLLRELPAEDYAAHMEALGKLLFGETLDEPSEQAPGWVKVLWGCLILDDCASVEELFDPLLATSNSALLHVRISEMAQAKVLQIIKEFKYENPDADIS